MSAYVLLNELNELVKGDKMRGLPTLINSIIQEHELLINARFKLSYDVKIILLSLFGMKMSRFCQIYATLL